MLESTSLWGNGARVLLLLGALIVWAGCTTTEDDDDDTTADDDDDSGETGCITVNGETPGYATLQAAVDHAQDGDAIHVCAGTFEGSTVVEKSLSILGESAADTILVGDINEVTVTIQNTSDVTVSDFTVRSTRNGIGAANAPGLTLSNLVLDESGQYGIEIEGGDLTLTDAQLTNHPFAAVTGAHTTVDIRNCTFADLEGYGIRLLQSSGSVTHSSFSEVLVPETTDDYDGTCIYVEEGPAPLVVDDVTFSGCTRVAVYGVDTDLQVNECDIADCANGVVGVGGGDEDESSVTDSVLTQVPLFGIRLDAQDSLVSGNSLTVSEPGDNTYGIAVGKPDGSFSVLDNEIAGYGRMAVWIQFPYADPEPRGGEATVSGNTVGGGDLYGMLVTNLDTATVEDNAVQAIRWSGELTDSSYGDGFGIGLWDIGELTMGGNAVEDVDVVGIFLQEASFESTGDILIGNHLWAIYVGDSAGTFTNLSMDLNDIWGVDARASEVELNNATITGMMAAPPPDQWEKPQPFYYTATAVTTDSSQLRLLGCTFDDNEDYHVRLTETDVLIDGNSFAGPASHGIYSYYGFGTISNNDFEEAGTGVQVVSIDPLQQVGDLTIETNSFQGLRNGVYSTYLAGALSIRDNDFQATVDTQGFGTEGYGIYAWDYAPDGATVEVRDNTFANLENSALAASNCEVAVAGSNTIDGVANGRPAIRLEVASGNINEVSISGATGPGVQLVDSVATVAQCTILGSSGDNVHVTDSSVQIVDNLAISDGYASGVRLEGLVTGSVDGNVIQSNALYGISCGSKDVTLTDCVNTMGANTLGPFQEENGCSLTCSMK